METLGQRIKKARGTTSQELFSNQINISKGSLGFYERDENLPNADVILRICSKAGVSIKWLLTGEGSILSSENNKNQQDTSDMIMIPMVKARLSAGGGSFETNGDLEKEYSFRREFIERKGNPNNMVLMRVSGDSMTPEIMDSDVVLIDQSKTDIQQGKMFAVGFEECIYLKRIDLLPKQVILTSTNEKYAPVIIDLNDDSENLFRVIGKVLWCAREYL